MPVQLGSLNCGTRGRPPADAVVGIKSEANEAAFAGEKDSTVYFKYLTQALKNVFIVKITYMQ